LKKFRDIVRLTIALVIILAIVDFVQSDIITRNQEKISQSFNKYIDTIHPQKIYLHLDKEQYYAKEKIRFCSYLLDGCTHKPDTVDAHIYVELINPYQQLSQIIRVKQIDGTGAGSFYLSDTLPEGIYQVRAYTNRMKNYGPAFFFTRNISIRNPNNKFIINPKQARKNRSILSKLEEEKVQFYLNFFPEGGQLLTGKSCRIAFIVVNKFGKGIDIKGEVFNKKNEKITDLITEYNGMGSFYITPKKGETYYAKVTINQKNTKKISLPPSHQNSVALCITNHSENIIVHILSNKSVTADRPANEFILIGQVRGKIYYSKALNLIDNDTLLELRKEIFPPGIIHFALINHRLMPVSERLFFINPAEKYGFTINSMMNRDSMHIQITPGSDIQPDINFNASLSVLLMDKNYSLPKENIATELLLTSDLAGIIEDPAHYLQPMNKLIADHTDLLMLTNGWNRYYWSDILSENYPDQPFESERGIILKGKITREIITIPYQYANVKLLIMDKYNDQFSTVSGEKGEFRFENLNYNDTINVKLSVKKPEGRKNLLIHVNNNPTDKIVDYSGDFFLTTCSEINMKEYRRIMNDLAFEKVKKRDKELDSIYNKSIYGRPDHVIWSDEIPPGSTNLFEVLQGRVPGVNVTGERIIIRGASSFYMSTDPLVVLDGVSTDIGVLKIIPPEQVDRIEILKGTSTSMYGSRGANGVIAVYTKQGMFLVKGEIRFAMLGYHADQQFIQPNEQVVNQREKENTLPLTIYWAPNLKFGPDKKMLYTFAIPYTNSRLILIMEGIDQNGCPTATIANLYN
jgi:TonB-dependent SusC/RagA subfamily outer membrane receptor